MNLNEEQISRIDDLYQEWLNGIGGESRRGQWRMMRRIAETFLHEVEGARLAAIEAGTGTGKTLAYLLAGTVCAKVLEKKLIVATSTVMLQEQVLSELANISEHTSLEIKAGVVKGRGRYLCPLKLDQKRAAAQGELGLDVGQDPSRLLASDAALKSGLGTGDQAEGDQEESDLGTGDQESGLGTGDPEEGGEDEGDGMGLLVRLSQAWHSGEWDGDRDRWVGSLPRSLWREVTNSRIGCLRDRCEHFHACPFFIARDASREFDLLVVNQDLLLADLSLGGGVILPSPEEAVIVIDEAHNLADKARRWASCIANPGGFQRHGREVGEVLEGALRLLGHDEELRQSAEVFAERLNLLASPENLLVKALSRLKFDAGIKDSGLCYFSGGELPEEILVPSDELSAHLRVMAQEAWKITEALETHLDGLAPDEPRTRHEALLIELREQASSMNEQAVVMQDFAPAPETPEQRTSVHLEQRVRWSVQDTQDSGAARFGLRSAPLFPGERLKEALWSRAYAVLCTSATLRGLGSFATFKLETGISEHAHFEHIESPFPYRDMVTFRVPKGLSNPRQFREHTNDIAYLLPELMLEEKTGLILFTSWRQLTEVYKRLPAKSRKQVLSQDAFATARLVHKHMQAVDRGRRSYLMGVASFAEGLDLPDEYCRHVIIAKLPFMVPSDPVERALREWYEARSEDAFRVLSLPYASLKMRQACGRLVRNENDYGRITLLDSRAANTIWGREIIESLPPYRMEFG